MNSYNWKKKMLDVFDESEKAPIMNEIHKIVSEGILGVDYTIASREKNRKLKSEYNINDGKMKEILLSLKIEDFKSIEDSNHPEHEGARVCKFRKLYPLMPKWREEADYVEVPLYIKIEKPQKNDPLFIISFHEEGLN